MGAQYQIGTLTGQTNGTLNGIDYSLDFDTLAGQISALEQSLVTVLGNDGLTGQLIAMNQNFQAAFSPAAGATAGTVAARIKQNSLVMSELVKQTGTLAEAVATVGYDTREGAKTPLSIAGQLAVMNANLQIIGTSVIKANTFNQAATNAALARNDLPTVSVPRPQLDATITEAATDATTMGVQAKATGLVTGVIDNVTSEVSAIGSQVLAPVTNWFSSVYDQTKTALGLQTSQEAKTETTAASTASSTAANI